MIKKPRTIVWDIETLGLKANDPILCVAWRVMGEDKINFRAAWQYPETWGRLRSAKTLKDIEAAFQDIDRPFLKDVFEALSTADSLVGHFEGYFDIPFVKSRFLKHKIGFLPKSITTDTWRVARNNLCLRSNRLFALNEFFGIINKKKQNDLSLWTAVKAGNTNAYKIMEDYNKRDVVATEALLKRVLGYTKLPAQPQDRGRRCQCGSTNVHKHEIRVTLTGTYQRYRCNGCGSYSKSLIKKAELRPE